MYTTFYCMLCYFVVYITHNYIGQIHNGLITGNNIPYLLEWTSQLQLFTGQEDVSSIQGRLLFCFTLH